MTGLRPGDRLGAYEILSPLGAGGMGEVYKARDTRLGRSVAVKILAPSVSAGPDRRARFQREARVISALSHPHICALYDVGEHGGTDYLVMEYLEGETLARRLGPGPLRPGEALAIAIQIGEGLAEAHRHGVVHRDLKPANVIVNQAGHAKILDFGLARSSAQPDNAHSASATASYSAELSREGSIVGTLAYLSPEQARGEEVDSRSDVFSFGVTLYQMLAGKPPFRGDSATAILAKIIEGEPESISAVRPDLSAGFSRVLRRCLQKRPEARYNDTRDLVAELRDLQHELSAGQTSGASVRSPGRVRRWVLAAAVAAAVLAAFIGTRMRRPTPAAPAPPSAPLYKQVTFTGQSFDASISSDGNFVAYVTASDTNRRLMVQDLAGGAALEILRMQDSTLPRWSPDGGEIVIAAKLETGHAAVVVPRLGGPPRRHRRYGEVVWSPDGSSFLSAVSTGHFRIVQKDTGTFEQVDVPGPYTWLHLMDWSQQSGLLFMAQDERGRSSLWRMNADGSDRIKLHEEEGITAARWSPRAEGLYFLRTQRETAELCKLVFDARREKAAGSPLTLLSGLEGAGSFTVSSDGRRLAYVRGSGYANLWHANLDTPPPNAGFKPTQLTTGTFADFGAQISPDGKRIAFARAQGEYSNIFVMPIEGGAPVQLTFLRSYSTGASWSPDGKEIAFGSLEGGVPRVWRVSSDGGPPRPFKQTLLAAGPGHVSWSPGKRILYQRPGNRNFHLVDPATEEERPLVSDDSVGWMFGPRFAPSGDSVAVRWNRPPKAELFVVPLGDKQPLRIAGSDWTPAAWSSDGQWIYAFDVRDGRFAIIRSDGTGIRELGTLTPGKRSAYSVDVHGSHIVFSFGQVQSDVWIIDNFDPASR